MENKNTWVEINKAALSHNLKQFRKIIGPQVRLLIPVKANAYGHGLVEVAKIVLPNGADWLGVNSLEEAEFLCSNKIFKPILILGYVKLTELKRLKFFKNIRLAVYNEATVKKLGQLKSKVKIHLKLETGATRQGVALKEILVFVKLIKKYKNIELEGIYTHFANVEDTKNHHFAFSQLKKFNQAVELLEKNGIKIPLKHAACSAAAILYKKTHFNLVRPGISVYGLWSSYETKVAAGKKHKSIKLELVLSWKSIIAQIKNVKQGSAVGYGRTEKVSRDSRIAVIPVGYWDGFDRGLSSVGNVLIKGKRTKVIGRICMNMFMVDVTDIKNVKTEDEVVLIGRQGREEITADEIAEKLKTINYEVVTRINPLIKRKII
ncbi:alanine racemase [Patescibacteria group bacterium]|nr:alanine racemase [Patescibacteria group bacterium]